MCEQREFVAVQNLLFTNIKIDQTFISRNRRKSYTLSFQETQK